MSGRTDSQATDDRKVFSYEPALDGIRALAVLLVMAGHLDLVYAGGLGVDIFFVLSGYLITAILVAEFRAKKFEPEAYTLYSYAGVQIIKQAAEAAKSLDPKKVADTMHSGMKFKTVIGDISYDKKGDITRLDYVMYVWKKDPAGKITYVEIK